MMDVMDKIEVIMGWLSYTDCWFVEKIKTVSDAEKLYDFAQEKNIEFLDIAYVSEDEFDTEKKLKKFQKEVEEVVGYKLY